jgi:hypothetical protein
VDNYQTATLGPLRQVTRNNEDRPSQCATRPPQISEWMGILEACVHCVFNRIESLEKRLDPVLSHPHPRACSEANLSAALVPMADKLRAMVDVLNSVDERIKEVESRLEV